MERTSSTEVEVDSMTTGGDAGSTLSSAVATGSSLSELTERVTRRFGDSLAVTSSIVVLDWREADFLGTVDFLRPLVRSPNMIAWGLESPNFWVLIWNYCCISKSFYNRLCDRIAQFYQGGNLGHLVRLGWKMDHTGPWAQQSIPPIPSSAQLLED